MVATTSMTSCIANGVHETYAISVVADKPAVYRGAAGSIANTGGGYVLTAIRMTGVHSVRTRAPHVHASRARGSRVGCRYAGGV